MRAHFDDYCCYAHQNSVILRAKKLKKKREFRLKDAIEKYVGFFPCIIVLRGLYFDFFCYKGVTEWEVLGLLWDAVGSSNTHYFHTYADETSVLWAAKFCHVWNK